MRKRRLLVLMLMVGSITGSQLAHAQSCQAICQRYYDYAGRAGAQGTYGPLAQLYNQCMACQNRPAPRQVRCPAGYMPSEDGPDAVCMLINCPAGTVREWDGTCIDARGVGQYSPEE